MRSASIRIGLASLVFIAFAGCKPQPLPEQNSAAGQLYAQQCGQCHSPYNPHSMTAAMWEIEVPKMEENIRKARLPALQPAQKQTIIEYLARNAGQQ